MVKNAVCLEAPCCKIYFKAEPITMRAMHSHGLASFDLSEKLQGRKQPVQQPWLATSHLLYLRLARMALSSPGFSSSQIFRPWLDLSKASRMIL